MLLRRYFLVAFAPVRPRGFTGKILAASYDLRSRQTTIVFQSSEGQMSAQYHHDSSRITQPIPSAVKIPPPVIPKITLRLEGQPLAAHDARRKLSTLMTVPPRAALHIVYPSPSHPDLTAIWSIDNQIYYTNNDYKNVYLLPATMREPQVKPRIVP